MYKAPRGTVDILPNQTGKWQRLEQILRTISANYNVKEVRTPVFEQTELFNRAVGETTDVVNKEMYTFFDRKRRSLTLRPEGTAGLCRCYVENKLYANPEKLVKLYYLGPMFRYERPQSGRQRQFTQFGVEFIGYQSPYLDVEAMVMAVTVVEALGIKDVKLHINTLGDNNSRIAYKKALQEHFREGLDDLCEDCKVRFEKNPLRILDCKIDQDKDILHTAPKTREFLSKEAKQHFDKVCELLDCLDIEYVVDDNLVRGLDYYCHTVFEIISDDPKLGAGSTVGGGGRYNGLVKELGGPDAPGVGFAFGLERLMIAMEDDPEDQEKLDVYVMTMGQEAKDLGIQITTMLRANGFTCDMDYQDRSLKAQFKSVDRNDAHFAIIIGEEEVAREVVNIKCTHSKQQDEVALENILSYLDHHEHKHTGEEHE